MKTLSRLILIPALVLLTGSATYAQYCGMPEEIIAITLSDGTELEVSHEIGGMWSSSSNSIEIVGDGFCVFISYSPDWIESLTLGINNSDSSFAFGKGIISLDHGFSYIQYNEGTCDLSSLPPDYIELWRLGESICRELLESEEFWGIFEGQDKQITETIKQDLELMASGRLAPFSWDEVFCVQYTINDYWTDGRLARGYSLRGSIEMNVMTTSPHGDQDPEIYLAVWPGGLGGDRWSIHIDPQAEVCEVSCDALETAGPATGDDWEPLAAEIRGGLEFFRAQFPYLVQYGVMEPDSDLGLLLEKTLEGLSTFPIEIEYKNTSGAGML